MVLWPMLLDVSVFGLHPILFPPQTRTFAVARKAPSESKLTWALNPDAQIIKVRKLLAACIDALHNHNPARRHFASPHQGIAIPVVAIIPRGLAAPDREEDLITKPTPIVVCSDRLLGEGAGDAMTRRQVEVVDMHKEDRGPGRGKGLRHGIREKAPAGATGPVDCDHDRHPDRS